MKEDFTLGDRGAAAIATSSPGADVRKFIQRDEWPHYDKNAGRERLRPGVQPGGSLFNAQHLLAPRRRGEQLRLLPGRRRPAGSPAAAIRERGRREGRPSASRCSSRAN